MPVRNTTPYGIVKSSFEPLTIPCGIVLTADIHTGKCRDGLESHGLAPEYARARLFEFSPLWGYTETVASSERDHAHLKIG